MIWLYILIVVMLFSSLRIIFEYERGVLFGFGKFKKVLKPGLKFIMPLYHSWNRIDMRINTIDVPEQDCITKDNVSVRINAVLYFKVLRAQDAVIKVENYFYAVSQLAQTTMRNIVGEVTLDELLANRKEIGDKIEKIVDNATDPWGIKVDALDLKDVVLPENLKRTMAKEAESERERRAMIISAEGEKAASENLMKAAKILSSSDGALHLRTLQNLNDISSDQSNSIYFVVPVETLGALEGLKKKGLEKKTNKVTKTNKIGGAV